MKSFLLLVICSCFSFLHTNAQKTVSFYVSVTGKDSNPGSIEKPFATLDKARAAVRLKLQNPRHDTIYVFLRQGRYPLKKSFRLDSADGGRENAPVIYSAYPNEQVSIFGGVSIDINKARPVKDPAIYSRMIPEAAPYILSVDLRSLGIKELAAVVPKGFGRPYTPAPTELFCNEASMKLARWPNDNLVPTGRIIEPGSVPRNGDFSHKGAKFYFNEERPKRWVRANDIWISGFFKYGYADDAVKVAALDTASRTIRTVQEHIYGFESGKIFHRWYAFNLLEEIDQPGEYYIDRSSGILYFYPPADTLRTIQLSVMEAPLIMFMNTSHVQFSNLTIECGRGMGAYIEGGSNNMISGCTFRNLGIVGVSVGKGIKPFAELQHAGTGEVASGILGNLYGHLYDNTTFDRQAGRNHVIRDCHIYNTGSGGISLGGGNRKTLEKGNNQVINNRIHDFNRLDRSYKGGVNIDGVGNLVRNNEIYNCPGSAILLHGNDHRIERNNIHHAVTDGDDMGALYYGRDPSESGNQVTNNFFHHIGNDHGIIMAVYHDDGACGMEVTGNVFYKAGSRTVMIGGGNDNIYRNNVFIESAMAFHIDNRLQHWAHNLIETKDLFEQRLQAVNYQEPPYSSVYPSLKKYFTDSVGLPKRNFIENNLFVNVKLLHNGNAQWSHIGKSYFTCDNGIFVDYRNMNFTLKEDAEVLKSLPGLKKIPFSEMGVQAHDHSHSK